MTMLHNVPTRALSILQPWAHAIVHLGKTIENRDWRGCPHRCEILIHASKGVGTIEAFDAAAQFIGEAAGRAVDFAYVDRRSRWRPREDLLRGGIVGRARIVGQVDNMRCSEQWRARIGATTFAETRDLTPDERVWWTGGFALVLADVEPVPFVACQGALGLWTVTPEIRAQIARGS